MLSALLTTFGASAACQKPFFGLKTWYYYLDTNAQCEIVNFKFLPTNGTSDVLLIGVALIDDLIRVAGFVAIGFVIYGGILYVTSQGSPDQTSKAQNTIQNALIGLAVAVLAVAAVSFLGARIGK